MHSIGYRGRCVLHRHSIKRPQNWSGASSSRTSHQSVLSKDPHASFGKHVLTPTLALTSVAAATPPDWTVAYWDENLLQGPPPWERSLRWWH